MSLEGQNLTPQNALETEQRFVLDTKEGLQTFHEFLVAEEGQIDALDPNLIVEDLALPTHVEAPLKKLRSEFKELIRVTKEGVQTETEELPASAAIQVANQYQVYLQADESFSAAYVTYESALENQSLATSEADQVKPEILPPISSREEVTFTSLPAEVAETQVVESMEAEQSESTKSEPLKVYGLSLPQAGPEGALIARSLRDRLEVIKNIHPGVKGSPERLVLVEAIMRSLFVVPETGLTEQQVARVAELAQALHDSEKQEVASLDTVDGVTESREAENNSDEDELAEITELVDSKAGEVENRTESENPQKRGAMKIEVDTKDDGAIEITFAHKVAQQAEKTLGLTDESVVDAIDQLTQSPDGNSVVAQLEQQDSVNDSIPAQEMHASLKREVVSDDSLTGKYLSKNPQYLDFIKENDIPPATFEKQLQKTIQSIDAKEIDFFESKFDEPYTSAFSYLKGMTVQEIEDFSASPLSERKNILQAANVKYEAYLAWMDTYEFIALTNAFQPAMKFAELLAQWTVETELDHYERSLLVG